VKQRFVKEPAQMKVGYTEVIAMPGFLDCRLS
jgi:hypothetical protein